MTDLASLYRSLWMAISFEFGVPLLSLTSIVFAIPVRHQKLSQAGIVLAIGALLIHVMWIRACVTV